MLYVVRVLATGSSLLRYSNRQIKFLQALLIFIKLNFYLVVQ